MRFESVGMECKWYGAVTQVSRRYVDEDHDRTNETYIRKQTSYCASLTHQIRKSDITTSPVSSNPSIAHLKNSAMVMPYTTAATP